MVSSVSRDTGRLWEGEQFAVIGGKRSFKLPEATLDGLGLARRTVCAEGLGGAPPADRQIPSAHSATGRVRFLLGCRNSGIQRSLAPGNVTELVPRQLGCCPV